MSLHSDSERQDDGGSRNAARHRPAEPGRVPSPGTTAHPKVPVVIAAIPSHRAAVGSMRSQETMAAPFDPFMGSTDR
jgi:hypothetical protein